MKRLALCLVVLVGLIFGVTACDEQENVRFAIRQYFGDAQYDKAVRVANCESGLNPRAVSAGGGNHGLFQINNVHKNLVSSMGYSWTSIYDPYVNSKVAKRIFDSAGGSWRPWGCRNA